MPCAGLASIQPQRAVARLLPPAPLLQGRQQAAAAPSGRLLQGRARAAVAVAAAAGAGEVCVVTGASQGIGKCIALELGRAGCKVRSAAPHRLPRASSASPGHRALQDGGAACARALPLSSSSAYLILPANESAVRRPLSGCTPRRLPDTKAQVVINYRDESNKADAEGVAAEVAALGGEGTVVQGDMGKVCRGCWVCKKPCGWPGQGA